MVNLIRLARVGGAVAFDAEDLQAVTEDQALRLQVAQLLDELFLTSRHG